MSLVSSTSTKSRSDSSKKESGGLVEQPGELRLAPSAQVVARFKEWVGNGTLLLGQRLPAERDLAEQLGVHREAVRSAMRVLDEEGLVRSNGGRLRMVAQTLPQDTNDWMRRALVIVTPDADAMPLPEHHEHGWREFITLGALRAVRESNFALVLSLKQLEQGQLQSVLAARPQGLLLMEMPNGEAPPSSILELLQESGVPVVVYGDAPEVAAFDRVSSDHEAGAYQLTRWLLAQGCRSVLNVCSAPVDRYWFKGRQQGYECALREAGLPPPPPLLVPELVLKENSGTGGHEAEDHPSAHFDRNARNYVGYLVDHVGPNRPCDAILTMSDGQVCPIATACRMLGREPGRDVLIAGYDNYWADVPERLFEPSAPAVTVDKCNDEVGSAMKRLLDERIAGRLASDPQCRLVPPRLVVIDNSVIDNS